MRRKSLLVVVLRGRRGPISSSGVSAVPFDVIVNFDSGSGALTAAKMNAGTHGSLGTWSTPGAITHSTLVEHAITLPFSLDVSGVLYDGSSGQGLRFDQSVAGTNNDVFAYTFSGSQSGIVTLALARWNLVDGETEDYNNDLIDIEWGQFAVTQAAFHAFAAPVFVAHSSSHVGGRSLPYTMGDWIVICACLRDNGVYEIYLQDATSASLLYASRVVLSTPPQPFAFLKLQDYLRSAGWTGTIDVKLLALRTSDVVTFPVTTVAITAPSSLVARQTAANTVTLTLSSTVSYHKIERNVNAGGWAVLESGVDMPVGELGNTYVDATLSDGDTAQYRVTALVGSQASSVSSASNAITVDNASIPVAQDDFATISFGADVQARTNWSSYLDATGAFGWAGHAIRAFGNSFDVYDGVTANVDQRTELTVKTTAADAYSGPAVRCSLVSKSGYGIGPGAAGNACLFVVVSGVLTVLATDAGVVVASGDVLAIAAVGTSTSLRVSGWIDQGSGWVSVFTNVDPGSGKYLDTGQWGVFSNGNIDIVFDDFKGYNL